MNKVLEYMAMGRPIVSFELREARAPPGEAARYAQPGDVAALGACLDMLLSDPQRRATMREAALAAVADRLAWQHQVPALLAAYDRASGRPARPGGAEPAALSAATPA